MAKGDIATAKKNYYEGLESANRQNNQADVANLNHKLFRIYLIEGNKDSVLSYAIKNKYTIKSVIGVGYREIDIGVGYEDLGLAYQLNKAYDSAYKYQGLALVTKDSLYRVRIKNLADFQKLSLGEALRLENLEKEKIQTQSKIRTYGMLAGLTILSFIGFLLYRNNRQKQKANKVLETTLSNLKSTQSQLIQSEKMASLGELTAGIAHEIQNPLNFVNNFSEVNTELIKEIQDERRKSKDERDEKLENELLQDIAQNQEKVLHHGKRADAIVKGMLQHSRSSSGVKEPTDINALADEYLRLTYHGLRAKDKSFNATFKTEFDQTIGNVKIIPQDIGRVILNVLTNAFYAVAQKKKEVSEKYEPTVWVSTRRKGTNIEISIRDNGNGIPQKLLDKIFQPFFTTKPTGQGTGLGLSLSYDVVKAHGGELKVETKEGAGSEFIIQIPNASFIDICGFTTISETESPDTVIKILNEYFDLIVKEIIAQQGIIDKFIGDCVLAVFKGPFHLDNAIEACLKIRTKIDTMPGTGSGMAYMPKVAIGINSGEMVSGNVGSVTLRRFDFTVIGDTVNTAQRFQSTAKEGQIVISESCYEIVKQSFNCKVIGAVSLKNKAASITLYEVID